MSGRFPINKYAKGLNRDELLKIARQERKETRQDTIETRAEGSVSHPIDLVEQELETIARQAVINSQQKKWLKGKQQDDWTVRLQLR